jgi:ribosomal protein S18 acetylase RimI-like enzyme
VKLTLKQCVPDDIHMLCIFSYKTFKEAFSHLNQSSNLKDYLDKSFHIDRIRRELSNDHSLFFFLYADGELAGYIKLNETPAQTDINDENSLEIERIYVSKEYQSKGLGSELMDKAIRTAKKRNKTYIWLGVWEHNEKAILFYEKHGFYKAGTHPFFMGEEEQTDFIMRKDL